MINAVKHCFSIEHILFVERIETVVSSVGKYELNVMKPIANESVLVNAPKAIVLVQFPVWRKIEIWKIAVSTQIAQIHFLPQAWREKWRVWYFDFQRFDIS